MEKTKELLKKASIFSSLSDAELSEIVQNGRLKKIAKDSIIFRQGEEATGVYVVVKGRVKVYKLGVDGRQHILHIFGEGETFAEAAVFAGKTYPAFAEAVENSTVFYLYKDRFLYLIERKPSLALKMLGSQAKLLREFASKLEVISLREVSGRLAKYLLGQIEIASRKTKSGLEIRLPMNKTQLASYLGTVSETLSRTLKSLKEQGIIEEENHKIIIKKVEALKDLSG
ncbi:MAG: Crp/Fnr family transcriptional regulator [Actinobacteria bacterium]|nr:MAG: Crp/Fnr family transcriptional regulator [Actinomycetota bacterium]